MDDIERLRHRLQELMEKRGLKTDSHLAEASGVSQPVLSRLLNPKGVRVARRPSHDTISKLERYFGERLSDGSRLPQPEGLDAWLALNRSPQSIDPDEEDAMRRLGAPPNRVADNRYWSALLVAIRAAEKKLNGEQG